jgi:hypothetical protein
MQNIPEALRLIMEDYSDFFSDERVKLQAQQEKLEQEKLESAQKTVDRIIALINGLNDKIEEETTTPGILSETDAQKILKAFNTSMENILKDANKMDYKFTDEDDHIIKDTISTAFPEPRTPEQEAFVGKLGNIWSHIKEEKIEYNIWNPTDKALHFINNFTNRLMQQQEINIDEEINALNKKIENILVYNRETGFKHSRQSDGHSIQDKINRLKIEAKLTKKAFEKADNDTIAIQDTITKTLLATITMKDRKNILQELSAELKTKDNESKKLKAYEKILHLLIESFTTQFKPLLNPTPTQQIRAFIFNLRPEMINVQRLLGNQLQDREKEIMTSIDNAIDSISQTIELQKYSFDPNDIDTIHHELRELISLLPDSPKLTDYLKSKIMIILDQPVVLHFQYPSSIDKQELKDNKEHKESESPPPSPKRPSSPG